MLLPLPQFVRTTKKNDQTHNVKIIYKTLDGRTLELFTDVSFSSIKEAEHNISLFALLRFFPNSKNAKELQKSTKRALLYNKSKKRKHSNKNMKIMIGSPTPIEPNIYSTDPPTYDFKPEK